jgi:hypothetical protein
MLREIEFIDKLALPVSEYIYIHPKHKDPKVVRSQAESLLQFQDPNWFPDSCLASKKLVQITFKAKGSCFSDHEIGEKTDDELE